ncbi:hypothetical protein R84B8_02025 [Treponema sp. R8-4-B8]
MKSIIKVSLLLLMSVLIFTTCDNSIGLGTKVNTEKPVIKTAGDENKPGDFIAGNGNRIWLDVEQEFGIAKVYMEVEYIDSATQEKTRKIIDAFFDDANQKWYVDLDTIGMEDGTITAWVTAIDVDGNKATTTDMVYFIKNLPPQIKLNMPAVTDNNWDDDAFLDNLINTDPLYMGFELLGLATDNYGIAEGYPKILIWPADPAEFNEIDEDGLPLPTNEYYGTWRSLVVPNPKPGLTATKFSWPMLKLHKDADAPGGYRLPKDDELVDNLKIGKYRIRIVTKDLFGNENYYPNRTDHGATTASKKYIEINYLASDIPIIQVTDSPQYYNGAKDLVVDFLVSSQNKLHPTEPVAAYIITKANEVDENIIGGPYTPVFQPPDRGSPYRYILTIPVEEVKKWKNPQEGTMSVRLRAKDELEKPGPYLYQNFTYDITPPEVVIDRPVVLTNIRDGTLNGGMYSVYYPSESPKWVTGTISVGGTPNDKSNIKGIYYHVGKLGDDSDPKGYWDAHYDDAVIWQDTRLNTSTPVTPWSGTSYAWTYTVNYPIGYKGDHSEITQELSDLANFSGSNSETDERDRFYLPFYVKVVDNAENFHIVHYKLCVDPLLDEPQVNIIYPQKNSTVGGTVRVTGTAEDNYWMHTVLMRIHKDGTSGDDYWYIPTVPPTEKFYPDASYPAPESGGVRDEAGWFKLNLVGDGLSVNWTATVNGDGKLNPPGDAETVDVRFDVVAIDTDEPTHIRPHIIGPITTQTVKFSSKVPRIEDIKITKGTDIRDYVEGISSSGKFVVSMTISALDGINKVLAKVNNDSQVTLMTSNTALENGAVWNITTPTMNSEARYEATLTMTVDSTAINSIVSGIGYGKTGVMNLEITVEDDTAQNFSATNNFRVGIDNFYPSAVIETSIMAFDDINIDKFFLVQGTAQDWGTGSGALQGLERVLVYFEKATISYTSTTLWTGRTVSGNGSYLTPSGSAAATTGNSFFMDHPNVMDTSLNYSPGQTTPNSSTYRIPKLEYDSVGKKWTSPTALVIDNAENDPKEDYDHDGTYGEKWIGLTDKTWEARMMISDRESGTQQFPDGPYMVHYIVMDTAGNATHYQKDIYIENNKPRITNINIGTDIDFSGGLDYPAEFLDNSGGHGYSINNTSEGTGRIETPDADFRIRNRRFGLRLGLDKGNGQKKATVTNVTRGATIPATSMERGKVYQIATSSQYTDYTKYGATNNSQNTVFIASSAAAPPPEGKDGGTVYPFTEISKQGPQNVEDANIFTFTNFDGVTDRTDGMFIVKVYDTVISGSSVHSEYDQLGHAVLLTVSINNNDNTAPLIEVANFGQKHEKSLTGNVQNYTANVLSPLANAVYSDYVDTTSTGVKNGYVQYQAHSSPNTTANISGKVIFNGKVNDNHQINKITVQIPGYNGDSEIIIASRNPENSLLRPDPTNTILGEREFRLVYSQDDAPQFSLPYGHTLVWQFMWDSSKISTVAQNNVNITFKVYDGNDTPLTATSVKNVNIVPYISEIITPLTGAYNTAPSAFNRSALGGYPVREGDTITINGFNFGTDDTNTATNNVTIGGGTNYVTVTSRDNTSIKGTVSASLSSGNLEVKTNNIPSFNNSLYKYTSAAYNKEPNNTNNNILDNSRYIYVWTTNYIDNNASSTIFNPFMRITSNSTLLLSYGYYPSPGNGRLNVNRNGTNYQVARAQGNRMYNTTVVGSNTNSSWYAMGTDSTTGQQGVPTSYPFFLGRSLENGTATVTSTGTTFTPAAIPVVKEIQANSNRFKIPRVAVLSTSTTGNNRSDGNADRVLIGYYDGDKKTVNIIYGNVGGGANSSNIENTATAGSDAATTSSVAVVVATGSTGKKAGMYTAVGFLSDGRPLIAWYDDENTLYLSYGSGTPSTNGYNDSNNTSRVVTTQTQWQDNAFVVDTGKGAHVDMAVDSSNNVHLAYYDLNNGGVYYALITNITSSPTALTNPRTVTTVKVDTFLSAGTKLMINVRGTTPYITYFHGSFTETKNSIRVAWQKSSTLSAGTDGSDMFTGKWEVMTVPVANVPVSNEFICNGVPSTGTISGTGLTTTNITNSILVGYQTNVNYEGAILKDDMTSGIPGK